jgi:transcriptional regulator with XRE-family HTH domain
MGMKKLSDKIIEYDPQVARGPQVPPPEVIGFFVGWSRRVRQWKQTTLAEFAGVSISTIERVERGEKVSVENLERVAEAFGFERGYFTTPRCAIPTEEAVTSLAADFEHLVPVEVAPLRSQRQVREAAHCHAYLVYRPNVSDAYDEEIAGLVEWFDLAAFVLGSATEVGSAEEVSRRRLYGEVLDAVRNLERRGLTILSGVLADPQSGLPGWKIAILSITPKRTDPGAMKRRQVYVDRRLTTTRQSHGLDRAESSPAPGSKG